MEIKTRIFDLRNGKYKNLSELAQAMGLSVSQVYRVREGKRSINQKFIVGAKKAFPNYYLDELFYLDGESGHTGMGVTAVTERYNHIVQQYSGLSLPVCEVDSSGVGAQASIGRLSQV